MEKNFGTRVRQARHKAGLTQAALAEKLNLEIMDLTCPKVR